MAAHILPEGTCG
jgi:hypothetical protein